MKRRVIVIGAGLAGLSAGNYSAMNGFETQIFEHHTVPGGVAAVWKRGEYLIDGGIHFVMGSKPGTGTYKLLSELGASDPSLYSDMREYGKFVHEPSGISLTIGNDLDEISSQLKKLAPMDSKIITEIFAGASALRGRDMSTLGMSQPPELASVFSRVRESWQILPIARYFSGRYALKMSDFSKEIRTPWLKDFFCYLFLPESPVWFVMMCLAIVADKQSSLLARGCLAFVLEIEKRFKELGGGISYKSTIEQIIVKNNKAAGVRLEDGREFEADYVISCGDGFNTIYNLLKGKYINNKIADRYQTRSLCRPYLTTSFGLNKDLNNEAVFNTILLEEPIKIGDNSVNILLVRIFNYSLNFAPPGRCVFQIEIETSFDYWFNLQKSNRAEYEQAKKKVAEELLRKVEKYYPGITSQVEVIDIATPYTTWRYTLNRQASWGGWLLGADNILENIERRLPGLGNLYLAGHWVMGGVPGVLFSGRHAVQLMCHDDGRKFVSTPA
jgi:phytoene desaturase